MASADLPAILELNTITDPPFHTEKIYFLRKINEKSSIPGSVGASQRGAVLAVVQFTIVWGKRCRTCLVKRGGHCRRLEGLRLYML